jgi:hypothetical protein
MDWLGDLTRERSAAIVHEALARAADEQTFLERPDGDDAYAAAEVVAAALGRPQTVTYEEVVEAIAAEMPELATMAPLALRAVATILDRSELRQVRCVYRELSDEWLALVEDLQRRLRV